MSGALLCGWFSFPWMGATAGDLLAAQTAEGWLRAAGLDVDVAVSAELDHLVDGGVRWDAADPRRYTELVWVCGPVGDAPPLTDLLARFAHCRSTALDVSMLQAREAWDPFDHWWARDGDPEAAPRPDLALVAPATSVPVVALVLVHEQQEYPERRHAEVHQVIRDVLASLDVAVVPVDTCFDPANTGGLRTPAQVEAVLRAADVIVTTRLHGLVLGLRAGTPVLAVDPVVGGAKITAQAGALGWPEVLGADTADHETVRAALERLLAGDRRGEIERCRAEGARRLEAVRQDVVQALGRPSDG